MENNRIKFRLSDNLYKNAKNTEKQIIMIVQATPKTHPGGVHGAWFKFMYHSVIGPSFINHPPNANAPKLISKEIIIRE